MIRRKSDWQGEALWECKKSEVGILDCRDLYFKRLKKIKDLKLKIQGYD